MGSFEEEGELQARARARAAVRSLHVHVPTARAWRLQVGQGADPGVRHLRRVQAPATSLTPATSRPWPLSRNSILELPADKPVVINGAENSSLWATGAVSRRRRGGWRSSRQPGRPSPVKRFGNERWAKETLPLQTGKGRERSRLIQSRREGISQAKLGGLSRQIGVTIMQKTSMRGFKMRVRRVNAQRLLCPHW